MYVFYLIELSASSAMAPAFPYAANSFSVRRVCDLAMIPVATYKRLWKFKSTHLMNNLKNTLADSLLLTHVCKAKRNYVCTSGLIFGFRQKNSRKKTSKLKEKTQNSRKKPQNSRNKLNISAFFKTFLRHLILRLEG